MRSRPGVALAMVLLPLALGVSCRGYRVGKETKCRVLAGGFDYCPPQAFRAQPSRLPQQP